ncbi:MAG: site-specific integrase [Phenylobacterium sp.]|uniref:site-specific integrase n=1 Tax=Phenylobacterium sp. TaxID=1871053 RepID=UPI001A47C2B0|nr:site-specific integrase [Phenylobacterium sp.]MBL8553259.1 site-specific integrase [Phenylobacterium sp.]
MPPGLIRRGARYYIRRRIPLDLIEHYQTSAVMRALGTSDFAEAKKLVIRAWQAYDDEFDRVRVTLSATPQKVPSALYGSREEQEAEEAYRPQEEQMWEEERERIEADPVLKAKSRLAKAINAEADRAELAELARWGDAKAEAKEPDSENPTIQQLHDRWVKDQERNPSTLKGMKRAVDRFEEVIGNKRIKAVARRDATSFTDKMRTPGVVSEEGVSIPNMNTTLSLLSALFGFAVKRDLIETNPFTGTQLQDSRRAREKRREFDASALAAIFGSPIYRDGERPVGGAGEAAYWLPLLALYTGARINELCQLHPDDVTEEGYVDPKGKSLKAWVIRIQHDRAKGQSVKTEGSERRIPVHADLIKLGFVRYAQGQRGKALLFDKLTYSPADEKLSGNWGRWWGRQLRSDWGVTDERMTFHSFRHSFKHYARQALIPADVHNALTGHETRSAADAYGGLSYPLYPLVEGMKRYRVPGFELPAPPPSLRTKVS